MIETMEHRGQTLYVETELRERVPQHGLCAQCRMANLSTPADSCSILNKFLRISRDENLICAILACPQFEPKKQEKTAA